MSGIIEYCDYANKLILGQADQFRRVCTEKQIVFEREAEFAMQLITSNDYLAKIAYQSPQSLQAAIVNVAAIGITLNPAQKFAYLVPRRNSNGNTAVCLDISYMGMMHLAVETGSIVYGQCRIVRANDVFEMREINEAPIHRYNAMAPAAERGEIVGAYAVVKVEIAPGKFDYLTHPMTVAEINAIRDRSESWKAGKSSPWKSNYEEMAKKTVIKQAQKYWPRHERLSNAVHHLDTDGGEGLADIVRPGQPVAPADRQPKDDEATDALFKVLEGVAKSGGSSAFAKAWQDLTKEQRRAIGEARKDEIKARAAEVDAARAEGGQIIEHEEPPTEPSTTEGGGHD